MPRWKYLATTIPILTILGVGIIAVYYKCKKRFSKIYRLSRNRGKTMETPGYNAVPVCTGDRDDIYMEEDNSMQHEEDFSCPYNCEAKSRTIKWKPSQHLLC